MQLDQINAQCPNDLRMKKLIIALASALHFSIATYITREGFLYGQGAVFKLKKTISEAVKPPQGILHQLVKAFSQENRNMDFDWDSTYAKGSNVINFPSYAGVTHSRHALLE